MKRLLKIIVIVSVVLMFVGGVLAAAGAAAGASGVYYWNKGLKTSGRAGGKLITEQQNLAPFKSIRLVGDIYELQIEPGDSYSLEYTCYESDSQPEIEIKDDILTVKARIYEDNRHWSLGNFDTSKRELTITVPKDTYLEVMDVELAMGSAEISGLQIGNMDVELAMGSLELEDIKAAKAKIDCAMGSVEMDRCVYDSLAVSVSMGAFEARELETVKELSAEAAMGGIDLRGTLRGNINLTAEMGGIELHTTLPRSEYSFALETAMGGISVDHSDYARSIYEENNKENRISASSSLGGIAINCGV